MELTPYTAIGGTHQWGRSTWMFCDSEFARQMRLQGFACNRNEKPYWSGALGGVPLWKLRVWRHGAGWLKEDLERRFPNPADRHVLSVSHGGQVAMMACAQGLQVASLVTITMPQRADLEATYRAALKHIGVYTNVYSDSWWRDRWQILGTLSDGAVRFRRTMQLDGFEIVNIGIKGIGHTDLVEPDGVALLRSHGVLERLKGSSA